MNGATPAGAWAGVKTTSRDGGTAVLLGLAQLLADRAHRHRPVLGLDDDAQVAAARHPRVEGQDEVALLGLDARPRSRCRSGRAGRRRRGRGRRASPRAGPRSRRPWPPTGRARRRGRRRPPRWRRAAPRAPLNPAAISWRNWCIGELSRVGSSRMRELGGVAVEVALEHPARSGRWRCRAWSRRTARRPCERSAPRSPRNFSSVRGSRPSPSAKFVRSVCSSAWAARSLTCSAWRTSRSNSAWTTSTLTVTPASWSASSPMRRARSTSAGAVVDRALGQERGERRVGEDEALDDDAVALEADPRGQRRRLRRRRRRRWAVGRMTAVSMRRTVRGARDI